MSQYVFVNIWLLAFCTLYAASIPVPEESAASSKDLKSDCKDCQDDVVNLDYIDYDDFMNNHQLPTDDKINEGFERLGYANEGYVYGDYEYFIEYLDDDPDAENGTYDKPKIVRYFEAVENATSENDTNQPVFEKNLATNMEALDFSNSASPDYEIKKKDAANVEPGTKVLGKQTDSDDIQMDSKENRLKRSVQFQNYPGKFVELEGNPIDSIKSNELPTADVSNEQEFIGTIDDDGNLEIMPNFNAKNLKNQNFPTYPDYFEYPDYVTGPLSRNLDSDEDLGSIEDATDEDNTALNQVSASNPERLQKWFVLEPVYDDSSELNTNHKISGFDPSTRQNNLKFKENIESLRSSENEDDYVDYEDLDNIDPKDLEDIFIFSSASEGEQSNSDKASNFPIYLANIEKLASWRTGKIGQNNAGSRINSKFLALPSKSKTSQIQRNPPKLSASSKFEDYDDYDDYADYDQPQKLSSAKNNKNLSKLAKKDDKLKQVSKGQKDINRAKLEDYADYYEDYDEPMKTFTKKPKGIGVLKSPKDSIDFPSSKAPQKTEQSAQPVKIVSSVTEPSSIDNKDSTLKRNSDYIKPPSNPTDLQDTPSDVNDNVVPIIDSQPNQKEQLPGGPYEQLESEENLKTFQDEDEYLQESAESNIKSNVFDKPADFSSAQVPAKAEIIDKPQSSEKDKQAKQEVAKKPGKPIQEKPLMPAVSTNPAMIEVISVVGGPSRPGRKQRPMTNRPASPPKRVRHRGGNRGGKRKNVRNPNKRSGVMQKRSGKHQNHQRNLQKRKLNIQPN